VLDVTVAICTAGERSTLAAALDSVVRQALSPACSIELLVVDNGQTTTDFVLLAAEDAARGSSVPVRYVREPVRGLGFARNAAIESATGELVAFLDDDAVADPTWAASLVAVYRETGAAVVGGRVDPIWEVARPDWLGDDLLGFLSILDYGPDRVLCHYPHYPFGVNIAFQRAVLMELGGFNTALGGGGAPTYLMDEIELCSRIERAGKEIVYAPEARVRHLVPAARTTRSFFFQRAAVLGRAAARVGWTAEDDRAPRGVRMLAACAKGELQAAVRAARHGLEAVVTLTTGREQAFVSQSRHVVWNLSWMWETGLIALKGT
jgi:cellulose synthase/poly-beta-1,6-N-acetylglucosamine synthase-like glycosyltransferase